MRKFTHIFSVSKDDILYVTDPCYDDGTWCQFKTKVKPGVYNIYYSVRNYRVAAIKITHSALVAEERTDKNVECFHDIGVDSGLCGFFVNKPNYTEDQWINICNNLNPYGYTLEGTIVDSPYKCNGVVASSGYGDGCYTVKFKKKNDEIYSLELRFI